jgi:hypothetical protein
VPPTPDVPIAELPRVPASVLPERLMHEAPGSSVSLRWLIGRLGLAVGMFAAGAAARPTALG